MEANSGYIYTATFSLRQKLTDETKSGGRGFQMSVGNAAVVRMRGVKVAKYMQFQTKTAVFPRALFLGADISQF